MADSEKKTPSPILRVYGHVLALEFAVSELARHLPAPAKEQFEEFLSACLRYADKPAESTIFQDRPETKEYFVSCLKRLQGDVAEIIERDRTNND